jgi:Fic family protein
MAPVESPQRIEPTRIEEIPADVADLVAELSAAAATLGAALHPSTAAQLAGLVRLMNAYYSNLIEGHNTRPRDIERALAGDFDDDSIRRNLQQEAAAHVRVQAQIDALAARGALPEPASMEFILWLHSEFYKDAPREMLRLVGPMDGLLMEPGRWRTRREHDVAVGRHVPPASENVPAFMRHFSEHYRLERVGKSGRIMAMAAAHHRLNYIHPFPDGNGRVSRLMSHAMGHVAAIGAHGLWSVSRGLARGLASRLEYKQRMDDADSPRRGDLDGRGNLSQAALTEFIRWFLAISLDQVRFMANLFELDTLRRRLRSVAERDERLGAESVRLLDEALIRGEFERGEAARITGLPERSARRVLTDTLATGLLGSGTPKGPVSLRFPTDSLDLLFPRLFPES